MTAALELAGLLVFLGITPGPANLVVMNIAANERRRNAVVFAAGLILAFLSMHVVVGLTAWQAYLQVGDISHTVLTWLGAGFLLVLLLTSWRNGASSKDTNVAEKPKASLPKYFVQGFLFNLINPKAWSAIGLIWGDFAQRLGGLESQLAWILGINLVTLPLCYGIWGAGGWVFRGLLQANRWVQDGLLVVTILLVIGIVLV